MFALFATSDGFQKLTFVGSTTMLRTLSLTYISTRPQQIPHTQNYRCMASTEHVQENVIQPVTPGTSCAGDNLSRPTEDDGLAHTDHAYSTNVGCINEHIPTRQAKSSLIDQTIICVICLEVVDEAATSLPCRHNHFHFSCLGTWLQQNRACPLCKVEVISIRYHDQTSNSKKTFHLPELQVSRSVPRQQHRRSYSRLQRGSSHRDTITETESPDIQFRRRVYERGLYSLYVGNNRISRYRNVTPQLIVDNTALQSRAKKWMRRELRALVPFQESLLPSSSSVGATHDSGFRNNEFLLEYVIAVLKNIDIKGSAGQAEILLREHLGRKNARLFLHELENWLRSPFETLEEWDSFVQYPEM